MRLKEKVAIVTGAGGYIGQAVVKRLSEEGAKIVANDFTEEGVEKVVNDVKKVGGEIVAVTANIRKVEETKGMVERSLEYFGRIDILVNAAGKHDYNLVTDLPEEMWDREIELNLKASFNCIQAVSRYMIEQRYGKIINFSSTAKDGVPWFSHKGHSSYAAARAGIVGLTRALAYELGRYNINVNCVVFGPIETPRTKNIFEPLKKDPEVKVLPTDMIPLQRLGEPIDVANAVLFLASDEAKYITGHCLYVSGGLYGV